MLVERTRDFPRDRPIDCRNWIECQVVGSSYRYWKIRYSVIERRDIDETGTNHVKSNTQTT